MSSPYYKLLFEIFERAHAEKISQDGKAIADATATKDLNIIGETYAKAKTEDGFDFSTFFHQHFSLPTPAVSGFVSDTSDSVDAHIRKLWPILTREADNEDVTTSLISLPYPYVVPGGRFNEVYYWDSYFTMLGLGLHGHVDLIQSMVDNFTFLIQSFGYIPNGNREYYLGRSQPPFYSHMVCLLADAKEDQTIVNNYLDPLKKEFAFFTSEQRTKSFSNGQKLYTYYDSNDTPRMEMYGDDIHEANGAENKSIFFRHMRAACESGWDFSSRWLSNPQSLASIHTTDIVPIDLNCLLYHLAVTIAYASDNENEKLHYMSQAEHIKAMINNYLWDDTKGMYCDFDTLSQKSSSIISAAAFFPLFCKIATEKQAQSMLDQCLPQLLHEGGIASTDVYTGQQWDAPNGWAPQQWVVVKGLLNYGFTDQAHDIARRWTKLNEAVFKRTGKMMEKYNVVDTTLDAGGGEYDVQDGFGWTNGVYVVLKEML